MIFGNSLSIDLNPFFSAQLFLMILALQKVISGRLTQVNSQNEYSELFIPDFAHLQKIIDSVQTQINQLNHQFQSLLNCKTAIRQGIFTYLSAADD